MRDLKKKVEDLQAQYSHAQHALKGRETEAAELEVLRRRIQKRARFEEEQRNILQERLGALRSMVMTRDIQLSRLRHELKVAKGRLTASEQRERSLRLDNQALQGQVDGSKVEVDIIVDELEGTEGCVDELEDEKLTLEKKADSLRERVETLEEELKTKTDQLADIQSRVASARDERRKAVREAMNWFEKIIHDVFGETQFLNFTQRVFRSLEWNEFVDREVG